MKATGWCEKHYTLIFPGKFRSYCRTRRAGKICNYFTYQIPEWKKASARELGTRYEKEHKQRWRKN